jgi:hypothetical protein
MWKGRCGKWCDGIVKSGMAAEALHGKLGDWKMISRLRDFVMFTASACLTCLHAPSCFALSLHWRSFRSTNSWAVMFCQLFPLLAVYPSARPRDWRTVMEIGYAQNDLHIHLQSQTRLAHEVIKWCLVSEVKT